MQDLTFLGHTNSIDIFMQFQIDGTTVRFEGKEKAVFRAFFATCLLSVEWKHV